MSRIALLGTGLLGSGMVRRFLQSGTPVTVWNRTRDKARALESQGASVAESPSAAVSAADHVHLGLSEDVGVDDILTQVVPALKPDAIVVDHSTTLPQKTKARLERMRTRGVRFLHAPVFMSPQLASEGKGLMMISGPQADYEA